ncbi:MAG: CHAP domain-containing protein [Sphingobacteriaceae bacterium]|nr:CHAP domain-containing protein [Sphingobacteriaceae bacterium]
MEAKNIIAVAKRYVGQKEKKGNSGFVSAGFEAAMKLAGWFLGAPWCAFFVRMVLLEVYASDAKKLVVIKKCCSGNAQQTFKNFKADGTFATGDVPKEGALVVWQLGDSEKGHIGFVEYAKVLDNVMGTIEGNTNGAGSREGDQVAAKPRTIERAFRAEGLNVIGYVYLV